MSSFTFSYDMATWPDGPKIEIEGECFAGFRSASSDEWMIIGLSIDGHEFLHHHNPQMWEDVQEHLFRNYDDEGRQAAECKRESDKEEASCWREMA
ncbi:MAG: hypothetical protein DSY80_03670 [Desulfocapsa sp.]|nr:MAG: hypothetical protein DSY80_03670 [Desulfocapsa sp.]